MVDNVTPLDERLGYLLKTAYARLALRVDAALATLALTARQLALLSVIASDEALSQIEVSARLGVDRTSIVAMLDELERIGLVERRRDERDRRRNTLALTASGRVRVTAAEKARADVEADFLARLDEDSTRRLVAALQALAASSDRRDHARA
ncbi:MarR family winged helix-turn-helix transcriptional regulator [Microbacterium elymi]|uniref:MarR family winged helix-turn-helix transcriptional regulator n=1 Tax=Microbacterium elymi TaxID=2909587 RepID=A0ABY5NK31_9MICO|nr:MarR family winged helix-turn-helix transcriptional regulator [Microbacterium elymi]UUT35489.1 MarR family winged helix-turn-helix transcriptional regulator [Microbacterium elymi]